MAETSRVLKIAIAGLGVGSTQIIPAMAQMPGMRLVAAADFRKDALETFKQKYGGRAYDSVEKLCEDPEVEAV
jgi:phthalate 4,5-cis-dihydrodiol dehydrogenase